MGNLYTLLRIAPPKLEVKKEAREIIIELVSVMCDNQYVWKIKKDESGDYKISTCGHSFSNFGIEFRKDQIEWIADDQDWDRVFAMINSGTCAINNVKSR